MLVKLSWQNFKEICIEGKNLNCQFVPHNGGYSLYAFDSNMEYNCIPLNEDLEEFTSTYMGAFNRNIDVKDYYTGKVITKDEPYNGPLYQVSCRFTTGYDSNHASWKPPVDKPSLWHIDVSTPGYTLVDFLPNFPIQVDGCGYRLLQVSPTNETVVETITLAPNIPEQYGGSYVFACNFEVIGDYDKFERFTAPKFLNYNAQVPEGSRIRFKIKHDATEHVKMSVYLGTYIIPT